MPRRLTRGALRSSRARSRRRCEPRSRAHDASGRSPRARVPRRDDRGRCPPQRTYCGWRSAASAVAEDPNYLAALARRAIASHGGRLLHRGVRSLHLRWLGSGRGRRSQSYARKESPEHRDRSKFVHLTVSSRSTRVASVSARGTPDRSFLPATTAGFAPPPRGLARLLRARCETTTRDLSYLERRSAQPRSTTVAAAGFRARDAACAPPAWAAAWPRAPRSSSTPSRPRSASATTHRGSPVSAGASHEIDHALGFRAVEARVVLTVGHVDPSQHRLRVRSVRGGDREELAVVHRVIRERDQRLVAAATSAT